jgi:hypothetical protein
MTENMEFTVTFPVAVVTKNLIKGIPIFLRLVTKEINQTTGES